MLLNLIFIYILSFLINLYYLIPYIFLLHYLNRYCTSVKSFLFYFCLPYNLSIIFLTCLKMKLSRIRLIKKYFRFERRVKTYIWNLRIRYKKYMRRRKMNVRIRRLLAKIKKHK
jgi:hypothetical protein